MIAMPRDPLEHVGVVRPWWNRVYPSICVMEFPVSHVSWIVMTLMLLVFIELINPSSFIVSFRPLTFWVRSDRGRILGGFLVGWVESGAFGVSVWSCGVGGGDVGFVVCSGGG